MKQIALIVEGHGDGQAVPALISKVGNTFGVRLLAPNPIRAGGREKLIRPGELERYAEMAASRAEASCVVVLLDHDDGCAVETAKGFLQRCEPIAVRFQKSIHICFAIREYECWLLQSLPELQRKCQEFNWDGAFQCANPPAIRGAKEALSRAMRRRYRETIDQLALTRHIDPASLFTTDRSFRKFVKASTGMTYGDLEARVTAMSR